MLFIILKLYLISYLETNYIYICANKFIYAIEIQIKYLKKSKSV